MSIFGDIGHFFASVGHHIKAGFVALFGQDFGEKLWDAAEDFGKIEVGKIALAVVKGLESVEAAGEEKAKQAVVEIGEQLKAIGISLPEDAIRFAIEFALQIIRNSVAKVAQ